jgi:hypothetical protein
VSRMKENAAAAEVVLTVTDLKQIEESLAQIQVVGARYPTHLAARVGR